MTEPSETFSLAVGGPLYELCRRLGLLEPPLHRLPRRIGAFVIIAWLPLLGLTVAEGTALGGSALPFLSDLDAQIRLLLGVPLLLAGELTAQRHLRSVRGFPERGIVAPSDRLHFEQLCESIRQLRSSAAVEVLLLAASLSLGYWFGHPNGARGGSSWYAAPGPAGELPLTGAGWWYVLVSLPLFRFLLLRWYFRLALWYAFLWQVSRLPLRLNALHPDRAGGIGFLGGSLLGLLPFLVAQTATIAGALAGQILHDGVAPSAVRLDVAGAMVLVMAMPVLPLTFFFSTLARTRRHGLEAYGTLSMRYVDEFGAKWLRGPGAASEPVLGSADIQSLADLSNAHAVVQEMGMLPVSLHTVARVAILVALPFLFLLLTSMSVADLIQRVLAKLL